MLLWPYLNPSLARLTLFEPFPCSDLIWTPFRDLWSSEALLWPYIVRWPFSYLGLFKIVHLTLLVFKFVFLTLFGQICPFDLSSRLTFDPFWYLHTLWSLDLFIFVFLTSLDFFTIDFFSFFGEEGRVLHIRPFDTPCPYPIRPCSTFWPRLTSPHSCFWPYTPFSPQRCPSRPGSAEEASRWCRVVAWGTFSANAIPIRFRRAMPTRIWGQCLFKVGCFYSWGQDLFKVGCFYS